MQNTTNDMTRGNSMKLIFQFFLPILIGNLFQQLYSFVDSMVVGKGIGDTALAAVGNTGSVHFLIIGFAVGLTGGLASVFRILLVQTIQKSCGKRLPCRSISALPSES